MCFREEEIRYLWLIHTSGKFLVQGENEKTGPKNKVGGRNNEVKQEAILNTVNRLQKQQRSDPQASNNRPKN